MMMKSISPILMDYHLHTAVTVDGNMKEREASKRAVELGIREIAFSNHIMLNQPDYVISPVSFIKHWENIQDCMKHFPELKIRLGIEMDYYPDREIEIGDKLRYYEGLIGRRFDLVLGSIHDIRGGFFSNKEKAIIFFKDRDIVSIYQEYFHLASEAARTKLFDIIAHPDLIKKYTYQLTPPVPFESYKSSVEVFIAALIDSGVGIELNTKGLKLPVNEPYPSITLLEQYLSSIRHSGLDPIITIGSDAHKVDDLGFGIVEMIDVLRKLKVNQITRFEGREKLPIAI